MIALGTSSTTCPINERFEMNSIPARELEDRYILSVRLDRVVDITPDPLFVLRLSSGLSFESSAEVLRTIGSFRAPDSNPRPLAEFPLDELRKLVGVNLLSWVIFKSGVNRIVLANSWHLRVEPKAGDFWRLSVESNLVIEFPFD